MAKPEWGVKRICPSCGARYYDMRKDPPVCPTCGAQYDPEALLKSRRARPSQAEDKKAATAPRRDSIDAEIVDEAVELEDVVEDEAADDALAEVADDGVDDDVLIEDTSELGEDDMDEVVDLETGNDDDDR